MRGRGAGGQPRVLHLGSGARRARWRTAPAVPTKAGPVGLAHLRPRRPAHLPRPHHPDRHDGQDVAQGVGPSHRRRRDGHPDGGGRGRVRRVVGRLLLRREPRDRDAAVEGAAQVPERGDAVSGRGAPQPHLRRRARHVLGVVRARRRRPSRRSSSSAAATPCTRSTRPRARCTGNTTTRAAPTGPRARTPTAPASSRRRWSTTGWCSSGWTSTAPRGTGGTSWAPSLATGDPVWEYQTDADAQGQVLDNGCGSVWSSGTVLPALGLVVFGTADCDFANAQPSAESVLALHISDGAAGLAVPPGAPRPRLRLGLRRHPQRRGRRVRATPRSWAWGPRTARTTRSTPAPGRLRWRTNVVFGGFSGGFIATTAYDGTKRVRRHGHRRLRALREQQLEADAAATPPTPATRCRRSPPTSPSTPPPARWRGTATWRRRSRPRPWRAA